MLHAIKDLYEFGYPKYMENSTLRITQHGTSEAETFVSTIIRFLRLVCQTVQSMQCGG